MSRCPLPKLDRVSLRSSGGVDEGCPERHACLLCDTADASMNLMLILQLSGQLGEVGGRALSAGQRGRAGQPQLHAPVLEAPATEPKGQPSKFGPEGVLPRW